MIKEAEKLTGSNRRQPTFVSMYSGLGCGDAGAIQDGWKHLLSNDIEQKCADAFLKNNPGELYLVADATKLSSKDITDYILQHDKQLLANGIDCIISSSSCKDISRSNPHRKQLSSQSYCFVDQLRLICECSPAAFLVENVDSVDDRSNTLLLQEFYLALGGMKDYETDCAILDASEYGAPQKRKRFITIGVNKRLGIKPSFPTPKPIDYEKQSFKALFPYSDGYVTGQSSKRYKSLYTDVFPTLTASDDSYIYVEGQRRAFNAEERLKLVGLEGYDLSDFPVIWQKSLTGNGIPRQFAQALFNHIRCEILYKSPAWQ